MQETNIKDQLPENFTSIEEAAEFWDTHSLADYWDQTHEVEIEVRAPRRQWVALASELAQQVTEHAQREGISVETLVNLWVSERLHAHA
ncbi:MAG: CopG family antitoxin [Caldilineaceae bacterium]